MSQDTQDSQSSYKDLETPTSRNEFGEALYEMTESQLEIAPHSTLNAKKTRSGRKRRPPKFLTDTYYHGNIDFRKVRKILKSTDLSSKSSELKQTNKNIAKKEQTKKRKEKISKTREKKTSTSGQTSTSQPTQNTTFTAPPVFNYTVPTTTFTGTGNLNQMNEEEALQRLLYDSIPINTQLISGIQNKDNWLFSGIDKESALDYNAKTITKDQVLSACYYDPGKIHNPERVPTLEICFAFDITGSMFKAIEEVKFKLQHITQQLLSDLPGIRISIIAFGDYCDHEMWYVMQKLDFTNDIPTILNFVNSLKMTGGGDPDEAYELALLEAQHLNWTQNSQSKCLVIIGDDIPHEANLYFNIDWKEEVEELKNMGIKIYGVQCLRRQYANDFYQSIADMTRGVRFELDNFEAITEMFMGLCYREATTFQLEQQHEQIANLSTNQGEKYSLMPQNAPNSSILPDEEVFKIHEAIHDPNATSVTINGKEYEIAIGKAGCRFVRINDVTYIEQNKEKKTKYAKLALEGKKITWITHSGSWGLIVDGEMVRRGGK